MNNPVLLATLGQRPQAITMALDWLLPRHPYSKLEILHTDPAARDGIGEAYAQLMPILQSEYQKLRVITRCLCDVDDIPLSDITDMWSAEAYFRAVAAIIRQHRIDATPIHLLVAGGRKAMSVYATLAAALLFGEHDRVWTILTSKALMAEGHFRIPAGRHTEVALVNLPVKPSRLLPGVIEDLPLEQLLAPAFKSPRDHFMSELTGEERTLVEALRNNLYASNKELGRLLHKAPKTIENQLGMIYLRLSAYYDLSGITSSRKRELLLNVINGKV